MPLINLSATLGLFRALKSPSLLYPHCTIATFDNLPFPLSTAFPGNPEIRAVVLDKDNCFALPHALCVHPHYSNTFESLKSEFPDGRLVIVSNSAGTWDDPRNEEAEALERETGVKVLIHSTKKPGCWPEVFEYLKRSGAKVERPDQVAVVGDRVFTDVLMANMMGSWSLWIRDGPVPASKKLYGKIEHGIVDALKARGYKPPVPSQVPI